jgi:hypothetical protein
MLISNLFFFFPLLLYNAATVKRGIDVRVDDSLSPSLLVAEKAKLRWQMAVCLAAATARRVKFREYMLKRVCE